MLLADFDYALPEELIAQSPVEPRNASRLMALDPTSGRISDHRFSDLGKFLEPGDALIFNDSRVIPARLMGHREPTGARVEIFLLRRLDPSMDGEDVAVSHGHGTRWEVLAKPGKKAIPGDVIRFDEGLSCKILERTDFGGRVVEFSCEGVFEEALARLGEVPLPPYIHERLDDPERYQTVYSRADGSAAAPTAGLHFTREQLSELSSYGVGMGFVTLHVGLGTFRPVRTERIEDHAMHREYYTVPEETADLVRRTRADGHRIVAVGTKSIRTLESAAIGPGEIRPCSGWTDIFIYPGYEFKIVDAIITNFHLPKSTLLMLVSAFAGRDFVLEAYRMAVEKRYRFFSFGDAMIVTSPAHGNQ